MTRLVLASTSPWRLKLLSEAGIVVGAVAPLVDEEKIVGPGPVETAQMRALAKAQSVAEHHSDALVVGADQVIHMDGETIGKPPDDAIWLQRLQAMRGRTHQLTTAVALVDRAGSEEFTVTTEVRFRGDLTDQELQSYIACGEARGCAGGYMIERRGAWLVESIQGDWCNVIGLPVLHLVSRLRARGWSVPS
jgi:septum formation protein